jgi:hypothetical protein
MCSVLIISLMVKRNWKFQFLCFTLLINKQLYNWLLIMLLILIIQIIKFNYMV